MHVERTKKQAQTMTTKKLTKKKWDTYDEPALNNEIDNCEVNVLAIQEAITVKSITMRFQKVQVMLPTKKKYKGQ